MGNIKIDVTRTSPHEPSVLVLMPLQQKKKRAPAGNKAFAKVWLQNLEFLVMIMSPEQVHLFLWMVSKLAWQTNMVSGRDGSYLTVKEIAEQYPRHLSERQVITMLNGLVEVKVAHRGKAGRHTKFHLNPDYVFFGEQPDNTLLSLFEAKPAER